VWYDNTAAARRTRTHCARVLVLNHCLREVCSPGLSLKFIHGDYYIIRCVVSISRHDFPILNSVIPLTFKINDKIQFDVIRGVLSILYTMHGEICRFSVKFNNILYGPTMYVLRWVPIYFPRLLSIPIEKFARKSIPIIILTILYS